jgi:hypothetical protein
MRIGFLTAALIGATGLPAFAQQPGAAAGEAVSTPGKGAVARVARAIARVEAIDATTRTLTLKSTGGSLPVVAGPEIQNFGEIRVGDIVVVRYLEALSVELKQGGPSVRERAETRTASAAADTARRVTVVAEVVAKDAKKRTAMLRGPKQTVTIKVSDPEQLKLVQVGDQVEATYTEAVVVSIEPALSVRSRPPRRPLAAMGEHPKLG